MAISFFFFNKMASHIILHSIKVKHNLLRLFSWVSRIYEAHMFMLQIC